MDNRSKRLAAAREAGGRTLMAGRPTWMLLALWECTEATREDMDRAGSPLGVHAAVNLIDWIVDELDARYPLVMVRFHGLDDMGHHVDLQEMYRQEYREDIR